MQKEALKKVILTASSGGHLDQIMCLKALCKRYECILVTENTGYKITGWQTRIYYLPQVNRKDRKLLINLLKIFWASLKILKMEKPDAVISTGVLATIPICILARCKHIKLIYIESFAKTDSPTKTGKLLYHFANVFIVQWENMLKHYPHAIYGGSIY